MTRLDVGISSLYPLPPTPLTSRVMPPVRNMTKWGVGAMIVRRSLVVLVCAAGLAGASAAPALAGEVKGPPGTVNNTNETGALTHANSACAASGLNDLDSSAGQTASKVQTAADSWKYYGLAKGSVGTLCRGGSGQR